MHFIHTIENNANYMKKILAIISTLILFGSCSPKIVYLPSETNTTVEKRDSIIYKTDTLKIDVPVEIYRDVVPSVDTLRLETSVAEAVCYLDTSTVALKGVLKNKKTALSQVQVVYKEKITYRDSIQYVREPYPVEVEKIVKKVPGIYKWGLGTAIVLLVLILGWTALKIYLKFK